MKKVLYIAPFVETRYKGGIMRIAEYLGQEEATRLLNNSNFEIEFFNSHLLTQSKNSDGKFRIENFMQAFSLFSRLKKRMEHEDYKIIHYNSSRGSALLKDLVIASILRLRTSKPILFQIHFCGIKETFLFQHLFLKFYFYLLSKFSNILLLSDSFKKELIASGFPEKKIKVIYNFHLYDNVNIDKNTIPGRAFSLIFVGSIDKRKGIFDLLEALKVSSFAYQLNIAGSFSSDKIEKKCREIIRDNNLNVNLLGYLNNIEKEKFLTEADILILPSYAEGFPMVIPEAMAFGCAIISTDIAGIPEIVKHNENGFLIKPGQVNMLEYYLEYLYRNRELLQNFKICSLILSKKFNLPTYIEKLTTIYNNSEVVPLEKK
jgi:glycosyltransferase involved in cell wall biosynthesis